MSLDSGGIPAKSSLQKCFMIGSSVGKARRWLATLPARFQKHAGGGLAPCRVPAAQRRRTVHRQAFDYLMVWRLAPALVLLVCMKQLCCSKLVSATPMSALCPTRCRSPAQHWRRFGLVENRGLVVRRCTSSSIGDGLGAGANKPRFLPPLEQMKPLTLALPALDDKNILPCFPLPLAHAALPGQKRTLNIRERRYIKMFDDMLKSGRVRFVVPRLRFAWGQPPTRGAELAEFAVVFELSRAQQLPSSSRFRYTCEHKIAVKPVRIMQVLNPQVFGEEGTYLCVECHEVHDLDVGLDCSAEERALLDTLYEVVRLRAIAGDPLRRLELGVDAHGRPQVIDNHLLPTISEDSLGLTGSKREAVWELAALWQGYCERRAVSLRQQLERDLRGRPPDQVTKLKRHYNTEVSGLAGSTTDLMQWLLQADTHRSRLAALQAAADEEAQRLGAIAAIQAVVGGEANA
mmetsp:Transcript_56903/g.113183  ORF Transcript_56903/g.113183 Transcript_56903/m.113183 type:complete len:461 (+) Transcript_56903:35-1417(+)|eukprot:CAMPEP_0172890080 /NCGR_PEP_ID=MMETSP1075-20121228/140332_1 /TAXON_ID=2916 /ORGANISM="Ceratium fusus, Strain PA161109" /LENGTH=460 /DNA_ID=CAMNT_0013744271 /DNA_START=33 /DNA_END=1415 /DNA_ORIENTATION=+